MEEKYPIASLYNDVKRIDEIFSQEEINKMFETLKNSNDYLKNIWGDWMKARDLCILAALRFMLLRPGEACGLMFKDINMQKRQLHIRGETNKEKKDRILYIPENFIFFYKYFMSFPKWMWKESPYLFPSAENKHISSERWKMIFREKIIKPAGLFEVPESTIPRVRSYLLRATGATEMLDNGADPWTVAQTLGHSDLRTIKNYFFQTERFREKQANAMDSLK